MSNHITAPTGEEVQANAATVASIDGHPSNYIKRVGIKRDGDGRVHLYGETPDGERVLCQHRMAKAYNNRNRDSSNGILTWGDCFWLPSNSVNRELFELADLAYLTCPCAEDISAMENWLSEKTPHRA